MMSIEILAACMKSHILIYSLYFESVRYMHDYTQLLCSLFEYLHPNDDSLIRVCILMSIHSVLLRQHVLFDVWLSLFSCIHHALRSSVNHEWELSLCGQFCAKYRVNHRRSSLSYMSVCLLILCVLSWINHVRLKGCDNVLVYFPIHVVNLVQPYRLWVSYVFEFILSGCARWGDFTATACSIRVREAKLDSLIEFGYLMLSNLKQSL